MRLRQQDLNAIGNYIYGPRWKAPLARAIGVTSYKMGRWASGQSKPSASDEQLIQHLACAHQTANISSAAGKLVAAIWLNNSHHIAPGVVVANTGLKGVTGYDAACEVSDFLRLLGWRVVFVEPE